MELDRSKLEPSWSKVGAVVLWTLRPGNTLAGELIHPILSPGAKALAAS